MNLFILVLVLIGVVLLMLVCYGARVLVVVYDGLRFLRVERFQVEELFREVLYAI